MPNYRRAFQPGGTFFLTLVTFERTPWLIDPPARHALRHALIATRQRRPFDLFAVALLPDHVHLVITLPPADADFSKRVASIKAVFSRQFTADSVGRVQSAARQRQRYRAVWQKRFWEHQVRDQDDLWACCDYVHSNPVKHGLVQCPHAWPWSTFHRFVRRGLYAAHWRCVCGHGPP